MAHPAVATDVPVQAESLERRHIADRIFRFALWFNIALTAFWLFTLVTQSNNLFFHHYNVDRATLTRVTIGVLQFNVFWGLIWYGVKALMLKYWVGFTKEERRQAFSSRMHAPFHVAEFTARYSERRIRIADMVGRRGRFLTMGVAAFFYLYAHVASSRTPEFSTLFLQDNLFDGVVNGWVFLSVY